METKDIALKKAPTGIQGLDEIIDGGLPRGRTSLICGGPGCGKTLLATEFLAHGAEVYGEPGVFMAFEETAEELSTNAASLGFNLDRLIEQNKIVIDFVRIERSEIEETGAYDLEGLFIRLAAAVAEVGAKRVVLDTIETIFAGFSDEALLRAELRRLFRWLKDRGLTAVVTGERGEKSLTRYGLEEYISDCVILLENRVENKIANRILRVVKYRGSGHGTDEYPFLIGDNGIWVQPVTSLGLTYDSPVDHFSSGVPELDRMLNGQGYFRGSSVLVSGAAGTGKTSLAAVLVDSACRRGERCLYFAFEEASGQIIRNMRSIGIDLEQWVGQGKLQFRAARPSMYGLEMHLLNMQKLVNEFNPSVVVVDPLTNLISIGTEAEIKSMLVRLIDYLKMKQVTALFTSLTSGSQDETTHEAGVSSLMDTWILLRNIELDGERNRGLYILKARGMAHSSQVREFCLSDEGVHLVDVVIGPHGVLVGSARAAFQAHQQAAALQRQAERLRRRRDLDRRRKVIESQITALQADIATDEELFNLTIAQEEDELKSRADTLKAMSDARQENGGPKLKEE